MVLFFNKFPYEIGPIRPPSEAASLFIRVTRNCKWNKCAFCPVYKGTKYEERRLGDVLTDIDKAAEVHGDIFKSAFLQDADALNVPTANLIAILRRVRQRFPSIERLTTYGRASTIYTKSLDELRELRDAGLSRIHRGLESGYDALLKYMMKGANARIEIIGGQRVKEAGIELSDYVMPGLGGNLELDGKPTWMMHAEETAHVINEVNPDFIRLRTLNIVPGIPLYEKARTGEFSRLSDPAIVTEIRFFLQLLKDITSRIESDHALNVLMEVNGKLPDDKEKMITVIDHYLSMDPIDRLGFRLEVLLSAFGYQLEGVPPFLTLREFDNVKDAVRRIVSEFDKKPGGVGMIIEQLMRGCI